MKDKLIEPLKRAAKKLNDDLFPFPPQKDEKLEEVEAINQVVKMLEDDDKLIQYKQTIDGKEFTFTFDTNVELTPEQYSIVFKKTVEAADEIIKKIK